MNFNFDIEKDYRITNDFMIIVGKYLEEQRDYVNLMKVCKEYQYLAEIYKFNPIVEPNVNIDDSLFPNVQTPSFYNNLV